MNIHGRHNLVWTAPTALGTADPDLRHVRTAFCVAPALGGEMERGAVLLRALPASAALMSNRSRRRFRAVAAGCR